MRITLSSEKIRDAPAGTHVLTCLELEGEITSVTEPHNDDRIIIGGIAFSITGLGGIIMLAILGLVILISTQHSNQFVSPFQDADPAVAVRQLPDMVGQLNSEKSKCESRAMAVIDLMRRRRISRAKYERRMRLYGDAKSEHDGCIGYLRTGLSTRFAGSDPAELSAKLDRSKRLAADFAEAAGAPKRTKPPMTYGDAPFVDAAADVFKEWMKSINERNDREIERLRTDLEGCRMREWDQMVRESQTPN